MASRLAVPLALLALTAAACSGGDETADTTPPSTAVVTTMPATTTTAAPATTAPTTTTTTPPTTAPTTTPTTPASTAPPVTASTLPLPVPDGFTLEEVQVIDRAFREGYGAFLTALGDVSDAEAVEAALAYATGAELENVTSIFERFRAKDRRLEPLPTPAESFEILQGPTRILDTGEIGMSVCHVAPYRNVEGAPGDETVLNDGVVTQRISVVLRLEDGVWKRAEIFFEGEWPGVVRCQDVS